MKRLGIAVIALAILVSSCASQPARREMACRLRHHAAQYHSLKGLPKPVAELLRSGMTDSNAPDMPDNAGYVSFRFDRAVHAGNLWFVWTDLTGMIRNNEMLIAKETPGGEPRLKLTLWYQGADPCTVTDSLIDGIWPDGVVTQAYGEYEPSPGSPWQIDRS